MRVLIRLTAPPQVLAWRGTVFSYLQIKPWFPERSEQFDFGAAVHDDLQACVLCKTRGLVVVNADLAPEDFCADGDGFFGKAIKFFLRAEDVDHIDGLVDFFERAINLEAPDFSDVGVRVHRQNIIADLVQLA